MSPGAAAVFDTNGSGVQGGSSQYHYQVSLAGAIRQLQCILLADRVVMEHICSNMENGV